MDMDTNEQKDYQENCANVLQQKTTFEFL